MCLKLNNITQLEREGIQMQRKPEQKKRIKQHN